MGYPTPAQWRVYASNARRLADAYRSEGNLSAAMLRDANAEFYEQAADQEEWRIAHPVDAKANLRRALEMMQ